MHAGMQAGKHAGKQASKYMWGICVGYVWDMCSICVKQPSKHSKTHRNILRHITKSQTYSVKDLNIFNNIAINYKT